MNQSRRAGLSPFLSYYGAKWRAAPRYPEPLHDVIVEPFAGSAGYACRYPDRDVVLCDLDPRIASIWRFLIRATPDEIMALPLLPLDGNVKDLFFTNPGARELVRGWLQGASRNGKNAFSTMAKSAFARNPNTPSFWGAACRARIAAQVPMIKHWEIYEGPYSALPNGRYTWFVDPPYNNAAGRVYRCHAIDYAALGEWCRSRDGQVIVCENEGADWLPFEPLYNTHNAMNGETKRSTEAIWLGGA